MRVARAFLWLYPGLLLAIGVSLLAWSYVQASDADAYRHAPQCGQTVSPNCYQIFTGVIESVQVSQTRSGERDKVVIKTDAAGTLTATLEPTDAAAPHVRTGANVMVKRYRGHVTLLTVDGYNVASTENPAAAQSDTRLYGWLLTGLGVVSAGYIIYSRRRQNGRIEFLETEAPAMADAEVLPSGGLGWSVRPKPGATTLARYALAIVGLFLLTFRALLDPQRTTWALAFDMAIVLVVAVGLWLFYRNAQVFADGERVAKVDLFGRTKSLSLGSVKSAERFSVGTSRHLVFVGPDGRKAFEVAGIMWDFDRLDVLCQRAGIHLGGSYREVVGTFKLNSRVPGTLTLSQVLLPGCGLMVLIFVAVLLQIGPSQR